MPTIDHARAQQLRCAEEIAANGWDERQAVLGLGDWFAEEFLLEQEAAKTRSASAEKSCKCFLENIVS